MGERALVKHQAAIEAVRGTDLPATRKVYVSGQWVEEAPPIRPNNDERGSFDMHFRSQAGIVEASLPVSGTVTFEDLAWWFQLALKGGVTGAVRGVTAYDYIFVPTQATDDLKTVTWETGDNTQAWEGHYGMVDTFEMAGGIGGAVTFSADMIFDDWTTATFTGALGDRAVEEALTHMAKLAIGATGAVPSAYMTGRFIGFRFGIDNNLSAKHFADGAGAKYTGVGRGRREFYLESTFEGNAATVSERANFDTKTPRVARLFIEGTAIAGSTGPIKKSIDIVIPGIWTRYSESSRETNTTYDTRLDAQYDTALAYSLSATVTNGLATLV